jgi:hypothetical protein
MCQNLLAFLKDIHLFSTTSIATSSASNVHLPHCVKLGTLFTLASIFAYAGTIGGMFSLLVDCWSYRLLHLLRSTMDCVANPLPSSPNLQQVGGV